MQSQIKNQKSKMRKGFTLPELLVSILMVVLLMLGVNQVFKMSSDTIGVGQTVNRQTRDLRSAIAVMAKDCERWAPDAPLFYIINEKRPIIDAQGKQVVDAKNNGLYKRWDRIGFPARGSFRRHTANDGSFVSDTTGLEAWIWYGHLEPQPNIPDVLGRVQLVLKDDGSIKKTNEDYIPYGTGSVNNGLPFGPLNANAISTSNAINPATGQRWRLMDSRFDLVGATIDDLRAIVKSERPDPDNQPNLPWWTPAVFRYTGKTIIPRPLNSARMAQVAPVFVADCEEFVVEFAGDYFEQDNDVKSATYGKYLRPRPDGKTDYALVRNGNLVREQIRWYGFPRDSNGDGVFNWQDDVVPVGEVKRLGNLQTNTGDPVNFPYFERGGPPVSPTTIIPYNVVFCNEAPRMIRVSLKLVDPAGRIQNGTWAEYILGPQ